MTQKVVRLQDLDAQLAALSNGMDKIDLLLARAKDLRDQQPEQARVMAERALELAQANKNNGHAYPYGMALALFILGDLAINSDLFGQALNRLFEAYALLQGQVFPDLLAETTHSIGWAHFRLGNLAEALGYFNQALALYRKTADQEKVASVLTSIGTVYNNRGDHQLAMAHFQEALDLQKARPVSRARGVTLNNMVYAQIYLRLHDEAIRNGRAAVKIFQELELPPMEASALDTLAQALAAKGELAEAEECLQACFQIAKHISSEHHEMETMLKLGQVYIQQGRLELARQHFLAAVELAQSRNANHYCSKYHELLARLNEELGDLPPALYHLQKFHDAMENSQAEAAGHRLNNLKILHQVEKSRKEAEVLWLHNRALEREIVERRREHTELEKLATTDPLTGLLNRRHFFTLGQFEFERALHSNTPFSLILLDIDHFKLINDQHGHPVGDQALIAIARLFTQNARKGDICSRFGGEEFILLFPGTTLTQGQEVAERIRQAVCAKPFAIAGLEINMTVSIGITELQPGDDKLEVLLGRADQALYRAKAIGRNTISL